MRIALVSDAWAPQVNGVVRTLMTTAAMLEAAGHAVLTVTPDRFASIPCPTYPEIRLALTSGRRVGGMIADFAPDAVHIATEGPLGWLARRWCLRNAMPFTTSFHTRFPDYAALRTHIDARHFWGMVTRFHRPARAVLVATPRLGRELAAHGLHSTRIWSRGVDCAQFDAQLTPLPQLADLPRPVALSVGRVAVEKNLEAFLDADFAGSKVVVGDGPALASLRARYPSVIFTGALHGRDLARAYAGADVFAFPSRTDTFGLVMIEALASGTPVAGYPVAGPLDIIGADGCGVVPGFGARIGAVDEDMGKALQLALAARPDDCVAYARQFSWEACLDQFLSALQPPAFAQVA